MGAAEILSAGLRRVVTGAILVAAPSALIGSLVWHFASLGGAAQGAGWGMCVAGALIAFVTGQSGRPRPDGCGGPFGPVRPGLGQEPRSAAEPALDAGRRAHRLRRRHRRRCPDVLKLPASLRHFHLRRGRPAADAQAVAELNRVVGALRQTAANPETRGPLVGVVRGDGELDLRMPPASALQSPQSFFSTIRAGLREADASAVGLVLPVRTISGEEQVCDYLDAEALALVAAEDFGDGVGSVGLRCPLHALPSGWEEAYDSLQSIAKPLRHALANRPIQNHELT